VIVGVDNFDGGSGHLLSTGVGVVNDDLLLRSMVEAGSHPGMGGNFVDRVSAVLAAQVLALQIKNGAEIVYPLSAVVARGLTKKKVMEGDDGTLFVLVKEIADTSDVVRMLVLGIALGDRGLHFAAGFVESPHIRRAMGAEDFLNYSRCMSQTGYHVALGAAERLPGSMARSVKQNVSGVLGRFEDARKVMTAIRQSGAAA